MYKNVSSCLQFALTARHYSYILQNLAAKIRNKKENTKRFINFF